MTIKTTKLAYLTTTILNVIAAIIVTFWGIKSQKYTFIGLGCLLAIVAISFVHRYRKLITS